MKNSHDLTEQEREAERSMSLLLDALHGPDGRLPANGTYREQHAVEDEHTKGVRVDADEQVTVEKLNDALQVVAMLSAQLHRQLRTSAQDAVDLEAAAWRATKAVRHLQRGA